MAHFRRKAMQTRINPVSDLDLDLLSYELETLGLWLEAEAITEALRSGHPAPLEFDVDLPLHLRQEIQSLNARV
jgi:hypothetical protein